MKSIIKCPTCKRRIFDTTDNSLFKAKSTFFLFRNIKFKIKSQGINIPQIYLSETENQSYRLFAECPEEPRIIHSSKRLSYLVFLQGLTKLRRFRVIFVTIKNTLTAYHFYNAILTYVNPHWRRGGAKLNINLKIVFFVIQKYFVLSDNHWLYRTP